MPNKITLPILLTWSRIFLVPIFVAIYYIPNLWLSEVNKNIIGATIFAFAAVTDYFDGYLARKLKQESSFGAFLDPVADKALVVASLVVLISLGRTYVFAAIIIIVREIAISALREWMAQIGKIQNVAVAYIGKLKTTLQLIAIFLLLWNEYTLLGNIFMILAVIFTIISMFYYLEQAKNQFHSND